MNTAYEKALMREYELLSIVLRFKNLDFDVIDEGLILLDENGHWVGNESGKLPIFKTSTEIIDFLGLNKTT